MKYDDKSISEIAIQYARLKGAIKELEDVRKDKDGAVLGYISAHLAEAEESLDFLQRINRRMQKKLGVEPSGKLELELSGFRNTLIKLPSKE